MLSFNRFLTLKCFREKKNVLEKRKLCLLTCDKILSAIKGPKAHF